MVSIEDLKDLLLYKKSFYLPVVEKDRRKGSSVVLLTPNYKSSLIAMSAPYVVNRKYYESYYMERAITRYIKNESVYRSEDEPGEYLFEYHLEDDAEVLAEGKTANLKKLEKKIYKNNFVFNGYRKDIDLVKNYFTNKSLSTPFSKLNLPKPKQVTVNVTSDPNVEEEFTDTSLTIYTPHALEEKGFYFSYGKYLAFILQLYAVYTIKVRPNKFGDSVIPTIAEPMAIYFSGIAEKQILSFDPDFSVECVIWHIVNKYGLNTMMEIARTNDIWSIIKYGKEISILLHENTSFFIDDEEILKYLNEDGPSAPNVQMPDVSIPIPDTLAKIKRFSTNLKRKMRNASVYKLNKIRRDVLTGNVGKEERGENKSNRMEIPQASEPASSEESAPEGTIEQFERWSNGDYIRLGNMMYLFEENINYDIFLRKSLYQDRMKNIQQVINLYKKVKADAPFIKYTYPDIGRYNRRNIFFDLSYYNESFFKNALDANISINIQNKMNMDRPFKIYAELMARLLNSTTMSGYSRKAIFIPVLDWVHNNSTRMWMYKEDVNPISVIYYFMKRNQQALKSLFGDTDIIFMGAKNYFKINFSTFNFGKTSNTAKFITLIRRIVTLGYNSPADPDPEEESLDVSPKGIAMDIVDKIEKSQNVVIDDISKFDSLGTEVDLFDKSPVKGLKASPAVSKGKITNKANISDKDIKTANDNIAVNAVSEKDRKDAIVDKVVAAASNAKSVDDALKKLDNEEFKEMIENLGNDSEENVRVDKSKQSKVLQTADEFRKKKVAGKSVKDMLEADPAKEKIPATKLNVASINQDWNNMTFMNFDKNYDPDTDIVKMLDSMKEWTFPIAVKNIEVKDNSTSEDILDLWTIDCVDFKNTKFTIKVDVPRFINNSNFLKLRGSEKNIFIQSVMVPIVKSNLDEAQIIGTGGYNKIFIRRYGARKGQSLPSSNKFTKAINRFMRNDCKGLDIVLGDNTNICTKYELPMDYTDIASYLDSIASKNLTIYFNQDIIRSNYEVDNAKGIPIGVKKDKQGSTTKEIMLYFGPDEITKYGDVITYISALIAAESKEFADIYESTTVLGATYTYSQASILNVKMPVVIICGYLEGLIKTMDKAGIKYKFVQEIKEAIPRTSRSTTTQDYIKFSDGYLVYDVSYSSSLLMNGLKSLDTESYSIKDINGKRMYYEMMEEFGSNKVDGIENSYDCMIDPITKEILDLYGLPTDYVSVMIHASNLLADNKYIRHTDQSARRWRRKEVIAGYFYKALTNAYTDYARSIRHNRKAIKMTMKQSAVVDLMTAKDPSTVDYSVNTIINDVECTNTVTSKGLVGMNEARAYSISTRTYDESMLNLIGMDTTFSGGVGINRQATIDANVDNGRGLVKTINGDPSKLSVAKTMTITEAMVPLGATHDDPQRTLMTYLQTSKHMIRCKNNDPNLITNGADEALPYLASEIFAKRADQDGVVVELVDQDRDQYMIIQYKDGTNHYIDLTTNIKHNSDGGYYVPMKLSTDLAVGKKFKAGEVLAYDKLSFASSVGESGNLAATAGTLGKVAILNTDEGFEDACSISESFAAKLGTTIIMETEAIVDKGCNIFVYKDIGDKVKQGESLFAYQRDFDDDVANSLLKNLAMDSDEISELGRKPVTSKYRGRVAGIEVYRTVELDELSPSLRKFVEKYERGIKKTASIYKKYGLDPATLPPTEKVHPIGKAKGIDEGVKIVYYISFTDGLTVGDKIVFYSACKGVVKYITPRDQEPYTAFRPKESVDSFMSLSALSGRMVMSIALAAGINKMLVELDRSVKDIAGIPYDESVL